MTFKILFAIISFLPIFQLKGQGNLSNIYLLEFKWTSDQKMAFKNPQLTSSFNSSGYNNHPFFLNESTLIWSSQSADQMQPDLMLADLKRMTIEPITKTSSGEYSTSLRNPQQKNLLSVIRMEFVDNDTLVRLWELPLDGAHSGKPLFPEVLYSGYHLWLNTSDVVLFEVGQPNQLVIRSLLEPKKIIHITDWPGRCFKKTKNGDIVFLNAEKKLHKYSPSSQNSLIIGKLPGDSQDFEIFENEFLLASSGKQLFLSNLNDIPLTWVEVIDLSLLDGAKIARIATNQKDKIALVVE
jgi:hypothetical protein